MLDYVNDRLSLFRLSKCENFDRDIIIFCDRLCTLTTLWYHNGKVVFPRQA